MIRRVYILQVPEPDEAVELLIRQRVDSKRKEKADRCKMRQDSLRSLTAGLLLQYVALTWKTEEMCVCREVWEKGHLSPEASAVDTHWKMLSLESVLAMVHLPVELPVRYGFSGKPFFTDEYASLFFSLSHSGRYVICGALDRQIGADIQEMRNMDYFKLADRFFAKEECIALEATEDTDEKKLLFYRLWARKEAYGKLMGDGLASGLKKNTLSHNILDNGPDGMTDRESLQNRNKGKEGEAVQWEEFYGLEGYVISICFINRAAELLPV